MAYYSVLMCIVIFGSALLSMAHAQNCNSTMLVVVEGTAPPTTAPPTTAPETTITNTTDGKYLYMTFKLSLTCM